MIMPSGIAWHISIRSKGSRCGLAESPLLEDFRRVERHDGGPCGV
jgi:hypothetical protein